MSAAGESEPDRLGRAYDFIAGDEDARVCKDIPDSACRHQPRNFFAYLVSNLFSKLADELSSARLILPWLMAALGAPAALIGFLVPIREAGVLLPQLFVAAWVRRIPRRAPVWLLGAALSGLALLAMALVALGAGGARAGGLILLALVVYSLARGLCSVAAKDVLGKTVSKQKRGSLMGYASSASGALLLGWGLLLWLGDDWQSDRQWLGLVLVVAGVFWFISLMAFRLILEEPGATEGGGNAIAVALGSLGLVFQDRTFFRFVAARAALLGVALAAPFYVVLMQQAGASIGELGVLVVLNGIAAMVSAPFWGRWSDRSSRRVMQMAAILGGSLTLTMAILAARDAPLLQVSGVWPLAFFLLTVSHNGARLGRKAYLVDMATAQNRATYVAVSNTLIGVLMLAAGLIGWLGDLLGLAWILGILAVLCLVAVPLLQSLPEVTE